jgi:hypothetical protein
MLEVARNWYVDAYRFVHRPTASSTLFSAQYSGFRRAETVTGIQKNATTVNRPTTHHAAISRAGVCSDTFSRAVL